MAQRTVTFGSFAPGVNNRLEPTQLATVMPDRSKGTYLYGADNVDLNEKGYLKRRRGQTLALAGVAHSLWADLRGGYAVIANNLVALSPNMTATTVRAGVGAAPVSFARGADGDVYWSNDSELRRIAGTTDLRVAAAPPAIPPATSVTAGALRAGKYLVAFTRSDANGESAATVAVQLEVPDNGGIAFVADEVVNVFVSGPNGDILTLQTTAQAGTVFTHVENGRRCETLNLATMPPGSIVRHYNGRMLVANSNVLFASKPYNYGLFDPSAGYFPFPAPITVVEPTDNGVYLCADKTYWIADFFDGTPQEMLPYGGIARTSGRSPDETKVFWQSPRGLVVADKNASVQNMQEAALELAPAAAGASLYREQDGMHHIISTRFGVETSVAVATSFMDAEVIRKGTIL